MSTSIDSPNLSNPIRTDVPAINTILKALAKFDPSILAGIENGTKRIVASGDRYVVQYYEDGSWTTKKKFDIDATSVSGSYASVEAKANAIALRDADGKLAGDITGNAATATEATALSDTLAIGGGGTGATEVAVARANLGVPPTSHASTGTSYGLSTADMYGHAKASATNPKALGTASAGSEVASFARGDHVHPTTTASNSVLGMVKLSDSTTSTSDASTGWAATPAAVKAAMDKASSAITGLSVSGTTVTYTKGDGSTGTITTQDSNTDTKVTNTLATTTKAYVTGTTSATTNTGTLVFDTGVYLGTTAGYLHVTRLVFSNGAQLWVG